MRVVSLCPSLTELAIDLGLEVVGRTRYCIEPRGQVEGIQSVGGTKNPKIDEIVALAPDLVLVNEEENRREDAEALIAAGLALHRSMPRTPAEAALMVRDIGAVTGAAERAEGIAAAIEAQLSRIPSHSVRYAYLIWRKPWMTISDDTFIAAMLTAAGGVNVFGNHPDRYPTVAAADLVAADPEVVLLSSEPFPFASKHLDELAAATGWDPSRCVFADGQLLSWHGSRTPRGLDYAARLLESLAGTARAQRGDVANSST